MKRILLAVCLFTAGASFAYAAADLYIDSASAPWNALDDAALRAKTAAVRKRPAPAVTEKKLVPPGGDAHDYMSFGPYWWPDPKKPDGLPFIRRDGETNPQSQEDSDRARLDRLCSDVAVLAAACHRLGDRSAGEEAVRRLRRFFLDPDTAMRPHLNFGQAIPGRCSGRGIGVIETHILANPLADALLLLRDAGALTGADDAGVTSWLGAYLDWLTTSPIGLAEGRELNNHGTSYDIQVTVLALYTGRGDLARKTLEGVPARRIDVQIEPDGAQPRELARTKSLGYSTMNAGLLCELAVLGRRLGVDLWGYASADGRSIPKAVAYMMPYWTGAKKWTGKQIEPVHPGFARKVLGLSRRLSGPLLPNAGVWKDDKGVHVNAHGGGVIWHRDRYWWYGEHKVGGTAGNSAHGTAVHVYSSVDLNHWVDEGAALTCSDDPQSDIADGAVIERPKVLFCAKTDKFVMRFHLELKGQGYRAARTGVAVSDTPQGPFRFVGSSRLNAGHWPQDKPDAAANEAELKKLQASGSLAYDLPGNDNPKSRAQELWMRDYAGGQMTRDQTLFVDDDGTAYQISASEENATLHIAELTPDYLGTTGRFWRMAEREWTEAPAICKKDGWYYLVGSGCTGWAPNAARIYRARKITGPWERLGNPCRGTDPARGIGPELTWGGQSTFILKVQGKDLHLAMFDVWRPKDAIDGRYVWLPVDFSSEVPTIPWRTAWDETSR